MSGWLLLLIAGAYLYACGEHCYKGNYGMSVTFFGYALGNIGIYWVSK